MNYLSTAQKAASDQFCDQIHKIPGLLDHTVYFIKSGFLTNRHLFNFAFELLKIKSSQNMMMG